MAPVPRATWSAFQDRLVVDVLRQEKHAGRQAQNGFKAASIEKVRKGLAHEKVTRTAQQVKDRVARLKKQFKEVKFVRDLSGSGWDDEKGCITGPDQFWEELFGRHPNLAWIRDHPFPLYDDLAYLFEGTLATGSNAVATSRRTGIASDDNGASSSKANTLDAPSATTKDADANTDIDTDDEAGATPDADVDPRAPTRRPSDSDDDEAGASASVKLGKRQRSLRGADADPAVPSKRVRASNASAMLKLAESVGVLVADITKPPPPPPGAARTPLDASPTRRDRAFRRIANCEGLTPLELARARRVFRGRTELADEYLSFCEEEVEARREWLNMELATVTAATLRTD